MVDEVARINDWRAKKRATDPDYFKKQQKVYREGNKPRYFYMLARYYYKKLTEEQKAQFYKEFIQNDLNKTE